MRKSLFSLLAAGALVSLTHAQSPTAIVVPAMTPATTTQTSATSATTTSSASATLKALQAMKAANDEILKQQTAMLQQLDEIEKVAEEIRIYTSRG